MSMADEVERPWYQNEKLERKMREIYLEPGDSDCIVHHTSHKPFYRVESAVESRQSRGPYAAMNALKATAADSDIHVGVKLEDPLSCPNSGSTFTT